MMMMMAYSSGKLGGKDILFNTSIYKLYIDKHIAAEAHSLQSHIVSKASLWNWQASSSNHEHSLRYLEDDGMRLADVITKLHHLCLHAMDSLSVTE